MRCSRSSGAADPLGRAEEGGQEPEGGGGLSLGSPPSPWGLKGLSSGSLVSPCAPRGSQHLLPASVSLLGDTQGAPWLATAASSWGHGDVPGAGAAVSELPAGRQGTTPIGHITVLPPPRRFEMSPGSLGGTKMFIAHRERSPRGKAHGGGLCRGCSQRGDGQEEAACGQGRVACGGTTMACGALPWASTRARWLTHSLSWGSPSGCRSSPLCTSWGRGPAGTGVPSSTGCPRQKAGGHWRPSRCRGQPPALF